MMKSNGRAGSANAGRSWLLRALGSIGGQSLPSANYGALVRIMVTVNGGGGRWTLRQLIYRNGQQVVFCKWRPNFSLLQAHPWQRLGCGLSCGHAFVHARQNRHRLGDGFCVSLHRCGRVEVRLGRPHWSDQRCVRWHERALSVMQAEGQAGAV
eukprot:365102-Chlamydomonas_euryale.AAC.13